MWVPFYIGIAGNEKSGKYADLTTKYIPNPTIKKFLQTKSKSQLKKN